ncbi:MAG: alginate lyase family protein [Pseudomonadota bacterium]
MAAIGMRIAAISRRCILGGKSCVIGALLLITHAAHAASASHPRLVLTEEGVQNIRASLGSVPLFDTTLARVQAEVDAAIAEGIDTPIPRDLSGGYTHERHKRNFLLMPKAGALYQILDDERYAIYLRDMLMQYEALYPTLPLHPQERSYARGRLFWQCLNDANWLLYASQGYDAIHDWLSEEERQRLETNLFRPFADFLSVENPQFFNRVHNHSTWGVAAVGIIGLVMDDDELVERALYGLSSQNMDASARDNDGGFIRAEGQAVGFLANLNEPFSPAGYYTEGPYYQRYAMYPFLMFAQSLNNARPELGILEYKDGVLLKAIDAMLQLTDADGEFFPLNDAQKGMSFLTGSVVTAVDIAYHVGSHDARLLDIAQRQGVVTLDDAGFAVAKAIDDGKTRPFDKRSINLSDGTNGDQGGVAILRTDTESLTLVFKYTAQGLSHGHYDKLSFSLFADGHEVIQDYGMARFVNVGQKGGGNYLPENTSWAKQTVAHNTVTRNQTSHFDGKYEIGSAHHSELAFFDISNSAVQVVSAVERNAYPNTVLRRTMALLQGSRFDNPLVLDVFRVETDEPAQFDLPFWYVGQPLGSGDTVSVRPVQPPEILGSSAGYQHLYALAQGKPSRPFSRFQWLSEGRFFTLTTDNAANDTWLHTQLGANDPEFNLRPDRAVMLRRAAAGDHVFASAIEMHGAYSTVSELTVDPQGQLDSVEVIHASARTTVIELKDIEGRSSLFIVANTDTEEDTQYELTINDQTFRWSGPYHYIELE